MIPGIISGPFKNKDNPFWYPIFHIPFQLAFPMFSFPKQHHSGEPTRYTVLHDDGAAEDELSPSSGHEYISLLRSAYRYKLLFYTSLVIWVVTLVGVIISLNSRSADLVGSEGVFGDSKRYFE